MGYCAECERLVKLESRGWSKDLRRQILYPVSHPELGDDTGGKECKGVKVAL